MMALCAFIFAVQTIRLQGEIGSDTVVFHEAVKRALADPALLYHDERGVIGTAESLQGFLYPPPSIAMLLPFGLGSLELADAILSYAALFAAIGAILAWLVMAARANVAATSGSERLALVMMALVTGAVFTCRLGQVDTLILAIVTAGIWFAWQARPGTGAAILAAGTWVKIYPALLMLPLITRRDTRWPAMISFAAGGAAVLIAALLIFPLAAWRDFFAMLAIMAERTIVNIDNQSLVAIWARTTIPADQALNSYDAIVVPALLRAAVTLAAVLTIIAFVLGGRAGKAAQLWVAAAATAIISLIAPLGWGHSYAYVLPLLILSLATAWQQRRWLELGLAGGIWGALVIPSHRQFGWLSPDSLLWDMVYGRYALVTIALLALGWVQMRRAVATAPDTAAGA
jgi:alpha-1,2-mannosyltransferase